MQRAELLRLIKARPYTKRMAYLTLRLNSRSLDILSILVAAERPLASRDIARQLHISSRMVLSSLASVEPWLQEKKITVSKVPGEGLSLIGSEAARKNLSRSIREYDRPLPWLSSTERLQVLLLTLFFADTPPQIKQLQEILNLSRTTTIGILDSAENWLRDYQLELIRRPNYGYKIAGDEPNWREAVLDLLQESAGDAQLLAYFQGLKSMVDISYRARTGIQEALHKASVQLDLPLIRQITTQIEQEFERTFSDQAYIEFVLSLLIAIYRNRLGKAIKILPDRLRQFESHQRLFKAKQIAVWVQEHVGLQLSEGEVAWIAQHFPEPNFRTPLLDRPGLDRDAETNSSIRNVIAQFLGQVSLSLHPSLTIDIDLIHNLTIQFETLLDPQQGTRILKNPLLGEVKRQYSHIYAVAKQSSFLLEDWLGRELNEAEIGNIAICLIAAMERWRLVNKQTQKVLVVCSAGIVTAWLLVSRLRAEFPDIEVVEVISALELENRKSFENMDFIVSTIPIRMKHIPSIQVNPLLGSEDCKALKQLFEKKRRTALQFSSCEQSSVHLSDLITPETIELGVVADNWQEVVEKAAACLLEAGAIESQFVQVMKEIILDYGPYMVMWPGVALLHAPPRGVRRLSTSLVNLRRPVCFGHSKNDPVQVAIVLGAIDNRSHITALLELNQMMKDEKARSTIQKTLHKSVVLHWVSHYSNSCEIVTAD